MPRERDNGYTTEEETFVLKKEVQFGFHPVCSSQIQIAENGTEADKKDPSSHYAYGVAYGARPLRGTTEFEVEVTSYGTVWSGTLKLGVMRWKKGRPLTAKDVPRYSPEGTDYCVWSANKIHNRLSGQWGPVEKIYGKTTLDDLRENDRLGFRLTHDGSLIFFVNGESNGIAAKEVYQPGYDVYPVIDHYANCKATRIVRAVIKMEINLQDTCIELISKWLTKGDDADKLPLPQRLKQRIKQSYHN